MTNIQEIWKDITGWEDSYMVSNQGRVKRKTNRTQYRCLKQTKSKRGYLTVTLCANKNRKECTVHRLIAKSFIPNPLNKQYINHIDGNKGNNILSNLEWCTPSENIVHALNLGLSNTKGETSNLSKLKENDVLQIRASTESSYNLCKHYKISDRTIRDIRRRKSWKHL